MPWSNNGTVQVSSGGTIATGTGTTFLSSARVGDALTIAGSTSLHEVTAIASDTQLTFQPPYAGTAGSGKAYRIAPVLGYDKDLSDAFNQIRLQWGTQLSSLQPWATAATADIALSNLGGSAPGTAVFKGTAAAGRTALGLGNAATATITTSATDRTAGRLLRVADHGIGTDGAVSETGDLNEIRYGSITAPVAQPNQPSVEGVLFSGGRAVGARASQIFVNHDSVARMFIRGYNFGRPEVQRWGLWAEVFHNGNILGTVSRSGGIPTGAIIERGSNVNGRFTKYADGTVVMDNSGNAIATNPVTTVGAVTSVDANKLRYGFWY